MATPYNIQDTDFNTPIAPLDWSFLSFAMQKKEAQYESGLGKVQSMYSSVLNSPISNPENQQVREQYLNEAKTQIQNLGKADLSLPQNIKAAQKVFSPFWEDKELVADIYGTKHLEGEINRGLSTRNSTDDKIRNTYDDASIKYLQWHQEDLKRAKRGDGSIVNAAQNAGQALWTPFLDLSDYAADLQKKEGVKDMNFTNASGGSLITEHNGPKSVSLWKTWLAGGMGTKFDPQFKVLGYVRYRDEISNFMAQNPGVTEEQAKHMFAQNKFDEINESYADRINQTAKDVYTNFTKPLEELKAQIAPVTEGPNGERTGGATPQQLEQLNKLQGGYDSYTSMLSDLKQDHDRFNRNRDKTIANIVTAPDNYYGSLEKENAINNWAQHKASDYTVDIDVNKQWEAATRFQFEGARLQEEIRHNMAEEAIQNQKEKDKNGGSSSSSSTTIGGFSIGNGIDYAGQGTASVQNMGNPMEVLKQTQNQKLADATVSYFNQQGVSGALTNLKVSDSDIMHFNTLMRKVLGPEAPKEYTPTQEQYTALMNVKHVLANYLGGGTPLNTYPAMRDALGKYITREAISKNGIFAQNDPLITAYGAYKNAQQNLTEYNQIEAEKSKFIKTNILTNKDKYKPLLNDAGTDIASTNDIASTIDNSFAQEGIVPKGTTNVKITLAEQNSGLFKSFGKETTISSRDLADAYLNKEVKDIGNGQIEYKGKNYLVTKVNNKENNIIGSSNDWITKHIIDPVASTPSSDFQSAWGRVVNRYGTYDTRDKLNQEVANKLPEGMSYFKDKTGKLGKVFTYEYGTDKDPGPGVTIVSELTNPANTTKITDEDGNTLTDKLPELGKIANDNKAIRDNIEQPKVITVSASGRPVVQFAVVSNAATKKNAPNLAGKTITMELSPSTAGSILSNIPNSPGLYTYQKLLEGKPIDSDHVDEAMGYKYHITPDVSESPTSATISIEKKVVNPKDGSIKWMPYKVSIQLANRTPDEIMREIQQDVYTNVLQNSQNQANYNAISGTGVSLTDWENQRKK